VNYCYRGSNGIQNFLQTVDKWSDMFGFNNLNNISII